MMTNVEFTKNVNFMTPGAGVLVQGRGHISHIVKRHDYDSRGRGSRVWPYMSYSENASIL